MSIRRKNPKTGIGIDLGTGFMASGIYETSIYRSVESPIDGQQTQTIAYENPKTKKWSFGRDVMLQSCNDTGDNIFMHPKRNLFERPYEKLYGGRYNATEITAKFLERARELLLAARPDLADYPQLGGSRRPADDLAIVFTTPANWGVEQHAAYESAIRAAGFHAFDGFVAEPIAAARRVAHLANVSLQDGDRVLVVDIGAGTTDIAVLTYDRGVFHQTIAASGDAYLAGHDFTNVIAAAIAREFRTPFKNVYSQFGLNLSQVSPRHRPLVMACVYAAEEAKKKLSVLEEATVPVEFPKGRKTFTTTREAEMQAWAPLYERFRQCVAVSLKDADFGFQDIAYFMLVGGSSRLPGLREAMATAVGRDVSEILVCTDSEHIVAAGAAEHAFFQDEASQALESGLGITIRNFESGGYIHRLLIAPGQVIPPEGLYFEQSGFLLDVRGVPGELVCEPFACKTGVRAVVVPGRATDLAESETVPLEEVSTEIKEIPADRHKVAIGVKIDPTRRPYLLILPLALPGIEPICIPLSLKHTASRRRSEPACDILLLLDCSSSMAKDGKLQMLQQGAQKFASLAISRGASLGIIQFPHPHHTAVGDNQALLLCDFTRDARRLAQVIGGLTAAGWTPMDAGLQLAQETVRRRKAAQHPIVVMFTDGQPHNLSLAQTMATQLKCDARLITVGIGDDVVKPMLIEMASSPQDYFYAECAEHILQAFRNVAGLVWNTRASDSPAPLAPAAQACPADASRVSGPDHHHQASFDLQAREAQV